MQQSPPELAISTDHLRKVYKGSMGQPPFVAIHDLSFSVPKGHVFGFLGPNGAGKTTTINILLGNTFASAGTATLLGQPIGNRDIRAKIGFLPEKFQFHDFLTADEFLDLHGKLYGMNAAQRRSRIPEVLEMVGLTARRHSKLREFSKGMQQRAGLAQAILNDPDLVILDEPTSALDPVGRRDVREIVSNLKAQGKTVLLNSHLLSEIEMTCDQVAIIKAGQVIKYGKIDDLLSAPTTVQMRILNLTQATSQALEKLTGQLQVSGEWVSVTITNEEVIPELVAAIVQGQSKLMSLVPMRETLEDMFIRVVEAGVAR